MVTLKRFDNNVRFVYEKIPYMRTVSVGVWVHNGSMDELPSENGMSHFIEHMLFKGTENRDAKKIASDIDNVGGILNAFTSKEFTCYYTRVLDKYFPLAIDVLADMFFNSKFDEEEIKKERSVILEEIKMYEDLPEDLVMEKLLEKCYKGSSFARPILGTEESLNKFNRDSFLDFMKKRYNSSNIVISVAGNFNEDEAVKMVESYFGKNKFGVNKEEEQKKLIYTPSIVKTNKQIEQAHLVMGYESVDYFDDNFYDVNLFSAIFGGNTSSTLNQIIREKYGYAYSIYSTNMGSRNTGLFSIYAGLNKDNINHVIEIVDREFKNYAKFGVEKEQLEYAKVQFKSQYLMSSESSSNRMNSIGKNLVAKNQIITEDDVMKKIDRVTVDTIKNTIERLYNENFSISIVGDVENININI